MPCYKLITSFLMGLSFSALVYAEPDVINRDYENAQAEIGREFFEEKAKCEKLDATRKKVCMEKAESKAQIAQKELDASQEGDVSTHIKATQSKIDTQYDADKVECDTLAGDSKALCLEKAKNKYNKAKADAESREKSYDTIKDKHKKMNRADYELAMKKCESLAGELRKECEGQAKAIYKQ